MVLNFYDEFIREIVNNLDHQYSDNYDYYRFGVVQEYKQAQRSKRLKGYLSKFFHKILAKRNYGKLQQDKSLIYFRALNQLAYYFNDLNKLYKILSDDESKKLLTKLLSYKVLGFEKVKLPLNTSEYWEGIKEVERIASNEDYLKVNFLNWKLNFIDLNKKNIPVKIYMTPVNAHREFILKQYEYKTDSISIRANKGDYVIDAGGCWGDTPLYFGNAVGKEGKVFTYEFIPSNLEILKKNVSLNPELEDRITIVNKPVWETSGINIYFKDNGPGSKVFLNENEANDGSVQTLSIDDLISQFRIPRIDFLKMDIEGAEPFALKGAEQTIRKYKPKLAIAIYHSMSDFVKIPAYLDSLNCGYKFYLGHYTIHQEETVLFASVEN